MLTVPLTRGSTRKLRPVISPTARTTASMSALTKLSVYESDVVPTVGVAACGAGVAGCGDICAPGDTAGDTADCAADSPAANADRKKSGSKAAAKPEPRPRVIRQIGRASCRE